MKETLLGWLEKSDSEIQDDVSPRHLFFASIQKYYTLKKRKKRKKK